MSTLNSVICIDVETGGLSPKKNPITQIAWQSFQLSDYKQTGEFSTFVQPYSDLQIEDEALKYTGITYKDIMSGMDSKEVVEVMKDKFSSTNTAKSHTKKPYFLGHNIGFDIGFIMYLFKLHKADISKYLATNENHVGEKIPIYFDTLIMSKQKWGVETDMKFNLTSCCSKAGIDIIDAHGAMNDVRATKDLFLYLTNHLRTGSAESTQSKEIRVRNHFKF